MLVVFRRIEGRGAVQTAHRALQNCGRSVALRYSHRVTAERDTPQEHRGALPPPKEKHDILDH